MFFYKVQPESLERSTLIEAIAYEKMERSKYCLLDTDNVDYLDIAYSGYDFEMTRGIHAIPKKTSWWCPHCVGWYGIPHIQGQILKRTLKNDNGFNPVYEVSVEFETTKGHCDLDFVAGNLNFPYSSSQCACLKHSVALAWHKNTNK